MPSPKIKRTEMTFASMVKEWINELVRNSNLSFGEAEVENIPEGGSKRSDVILFSSPTSGKAVCVIEFKQPYEDVLSGSVLDQAFGYARKCEANFFCTCNGRTLAWLDTQVVIATGGMSITRGLLSKFDLSSIVSFDRISNKDQLDIKAGLREFLRALHERHYNKKLTPPKGINEFLVIRLQSAIEQLSYHYLNLVEQKAMLDREFTKQLQEWFAEQGWSFAFDQQDYEKVARQAAYLLVNKILLYTALQQYWRNLEKLVIPDSLRRGGMLMHLLQGYFRHVLEVDYGTIFSTDNIDIGFPDNEDAVAVVRDLVNDVNKYNITNIGYDVIGYIFERLIPKDERHKLGQYFTPAEVVDLMLVFCSKEYTDKIFDPAVGAGTCLVRAYQYKKIESYSTSHEDILKLLWGCDIAQFPAHLTAINVAVRGLESRRNFPRILHRDFFKLAPDTISFRLPVIAESSHEHLWASVVDHVDEHVGFFNVIIGNPPYTRQEYLGDLTGSSTYKEELIKNALLDANGTKLAVLSKRAGLYAYFFVHAYKFLAEGGRLAFVTSNAWLNASYGSGLQEFLLNNFKIIAIMESDKERWFPGVAVDNCIVVLEKCSGAEKASERGANIVCFVKFHRPLIPEFVNAASNDEESQNDRFGKLKRLIRHIERCDEFRDDGKLRIYPKSQSELLKEGIAEGSDGEKLTYVGSRWGKFTTAPSVFYKLVERSQEKLLPLADLADVKYGLKTGANEFFYLTEDEIKKRGIEQEFWGREVETIFVPNYVMKSPTESEMVLVDISTLKLRALLFNRHQEALYDTHAWSYIEEGARRAFNERPTCAQRNPDRKEKEDDTSRPSEDRIITYGWYDLGELPRTKILWPKLSSSSRKKRVFLSEVPVIANDKLYAVYPHEPHMEKALVAAANSTIVDFFSEFASLSYGGFRAPSDLSVYETRKLLVPNLSLLTDEQLHRLEVAFNNYSTQKLGSLRQEYGIEQENVIYLNKIQPNLRAIDEILMGELLELTDQEQLEIYTTVFELAEGRFLKAKSGEITTRATFKEGIDIEAFVTMVTTDAEVIEDINNINSLYRSLVLGKNPVPVEILPAGKFRGKPELKPTLWGYELYLGKTKKSFTKSEYGRALYYQAWAIIRVPTIQMPLEIDNLVNEAADLLAEIEDLDDTVESYTSKIVDRRQRMVIKSRIWNELKERLLAISINPSQ